LLLSLALSVFAIAPLTYPGYMQVHSGFVPAYNLADLAARPFSPGWVPTIATRFDPLRGDGLLPYYLALPIVWAGGTPLLGVKVIFALGWLLGALGMYLWLRRALGPAGATLAALVYTYLPYRIAAVYVRGAWGEALCLGLLPLAMLAVTRPACGRLGVRAVLAGLAWAALGSSQPGLAGWCWLLMLGWLLLSGLSRGSRPDIGRLRLKRVLLAGTALCGVLAAGIFGEWAAGWSALPAIVNFDEHFVNPAQLFSAFWGFGASRPGWDDGLSLGFGFAGVGLTMLTLVLSLRPVCQDAPEAGSEMSSRLLAEPGSVRLRAPFISALVLTGLLFSPSSVVWQPSGLSQLVTYPWQLLGLIGLCLSVLAGAVVQLDARLAELPMRAGLIVLTLLASTSYLEPRYTQFAPGSQPLATWDANRLLLLDDDIQVAVPPHAAGLSQPTHGWVPIGDYGSPQPGDTLDVRLTWQITRPFDRDLKLFVHLLSGGGRLLAQADPLAGAGSGAQGDDYFTSRWDPGQLIVTDVAVTLPLDAPAGPYRMAFGLYNGMSLERLPLAGSQDGEMVVEVGSKE
jgi:hypothetical protein